MPRELYRSDVSMGALALLALLWTFARPGRLEVWPSTKTLSEALTGSSTRTIRRRLKELEACGLLTPGVWKIGGRDLPGWCLRGPPGWTDRVADADKVGSRSGQSWSPDVPKVSVIEDSKKLQGKTQTKTARVREASNPDWQPLLTELGMWTPEGCPRLTPGTRAPKGLLEVLETAGFDETLRVYREYAAICRDKPEERRWWGVGMFTPNAFAQIQRIVTEHQVRPVQEDSYL